ncbi:tRNA-splicing endonuclease subunit sen54 N-term-domain-containing protein [Hysterangium stoloniferum]|nr:tRNA-splicing endonuclease subunit sen54 N-term-domain-containing protein [Hysterangium stoloniferum]
MDDNLGQPTSVPPKIHEEEGNDDFSGDEDEGPDWTKFKSFASSSKPSLPKRGDKEFEPSVTGPTDLQTFSLNRTRDAMFGALEGDRGISNKSVSYGVWYPTLARTEVTQQRGVLFNGLGHSAPRPVVTTGDNEGGKAKMHKRTELLPEEALYLIERGSLFCWKDSPAIPSDKDGDTMGEHEIRGSPMSVQQAYTEMIGKEDLTLDRYHAYAYLKRLGFHVLRANPPSPHYPVSLPMLTASKQPNFLARILSPFLDLLSRVKAFLFSRKIDWWRPVHFGWLLGCAPNYPSIYRALRIIPSGHNLPLHMPPPHPESPYEIFYHIYKPNTPFRKSAPPPPDFSLVVVNARTTILPTLDELTRLWSVLPETGPPVPRQKHHSKSQLSAKPPKSVPNHVAPSPEPLRFTHLLSWFRNREPQDNGPPPFKPHPFAVLKGGKKTVVIGVVDSGTVGFYRFGMGAFEEMPMI